MVRCALRRSSPRCPLLWWRSFQLIHQTVSCVICASLALFCVTGWFVCGFVATWSAACIPVLESTDLARGGFLVEFGVHVAEVDILVGEVIPSVSWRVAVHLGGPQLCGSTQSAMTLAAFGIKVRPGSRCGPAVQKCSHTGFICAYACWSECLNYICLSVSTTRSSCMAKSVPIYFSIFFSKLTPVSQRKIKHRDTKISISISIDTDTRAHRYQHYTQVQRNSTSARTLRQERLIDGEFVIP